MTGSSRKACVLFVALLCAVVAFAGERKETGERIQGLRLQIEALLTRYTELHPDVVSLRRQIKRLEDGIQIRR